jgi:lysozyme family protein
MNPATQLRLEIRRAIGTLQRRHATSTDQAERRTIKATIAALNRKIAVVNQVRLLDVAKAVSSATDDLQRVVGAARIGPFDGYLSALEGHLEALYALSGQVHAIDALAPAPSGSAGARMSAVRRSKAGAGAAAGELPAPVATKDYSRLKDEYQSYYDRCTVRPEQRGNVAYYVRRLNQGQATYDAVGRDLNGIPWAFIGAIHAMECGFNFAGHMHNGDPLTARTVQVPRGRPRNGEPPFTWRESAIDAMTMKGFHEVTDWSIPHMLYLLEKYNGFGYRMRGLASPYLWSFSNHYSKGKFVRDGVYDPNAVSKQCGVAVMLKAVW